MINHLKLQQNIENEYEAQQLNDFYNQENESKKEKLQKIRDDYYLKQTILKTKLKEKINANHK
jgi:hypothetical protein